MRRRSLRPLTLCAGLALAAGAQALAYDKAAPSPPAKPSSAAAATVTPTGKLVDSNLASASELKTLPGVGDTEASRIIANRPYMTKTGLVEKKVLELAAYDALKQRIVVVHKTPPPKPKSNS